MKYRVEMLIQTANDPLTPYHQVSFIDATSPNVARLLAESAPLTERSEPVDSVTILSVEEAGDV